ncbi:MAG: terminase family protein [bacterium]
MVTGNRWGKSFVCAVKIIHHALYRPRKLEFDKSGRYRIVTASITQDQANIIFNQVVRFARQSKIIEPLLTSIVRTPYPKMEFGNGSTIEARSTQNRGEYLLGNDYDLFIFDEVAFETDPDYVVEEVIVMRLADREGRLDLISTPNGKNWFYKRVRDILSGKRNGYAQYGDSRENIYISQEYLEERLKYFSDHRIQQNIMGQFVDTGGEILRSDYIENALEGFIENRNNFDDLLKGKCPLISGWDLARKRTATVGITIAVTDKGVFVVKLERLRLFDWEVVLEKIRQRQMEFPGQLIVDGTGLGDVIVEQLKDFNPSSVIFTPSSKAEMLTNVELFHAQKKIFYDKWELPDGPGKTWSLENELGEARWDNNNQCDALMALALALWPLRTKSRIVINPRIGKV